MTPPSGQVLVFDVNETLLDIDSLIPVFDDVFGDPASMREWFAQLVLYSMTLTMSGSYVDFFSLGRAVLHMLADIRGVTIGEGELSRLSRAMSTMPALPDVETGLELLRTKGFRLVTLTNSPTSASNPTPIDNAGLGGYFEKQFSADPRRAFKPDRTVYQQVFQDLQVRPADCTMVAAHCWDTLGAQATGMRGALITRPGNAALDAPSIPKPDVVATDLHDLARRLGAAHPKQGAQA